LYNRRHEPVHCPGASARQTSRREPYFEALVIQEDAAIAQAASFFSNPDPQYSDAAWLTQLQRVLTAATAAFPTRARGTEQLFQPADLRRGAEQWMATNRISAGSADTAGQSSLSTMARPSSPMGMQTYLGVDSNAV